MQYFYNRQLHPPFMSRRVKGAAIGPEGYRTEDPEETLARIEPLTRKAGISRIADITGLDRVGIPVFSSIRPPPRPAPSPSITERASHRRRPRSPPSWKG